MVTDHFEAAGCRFEVVDMDKNRVDKVLLIKLQAPVEVADDAAA